MMYEHKIMVSSFHIHVERRIDRMKIETALDEIDDLNVKRYIDFVAPVLVVKLNSVIRSILIST